MIQFSTQPKYLVSHVEHAIVFDRESKERINFAVQHFGGCQEVDLVVFSPDEDEPIIRQGITLSYQETRLLRDLLNHPEVQQMLDKE